MRITIFLIVFFFCLSLNPLKIGAEELLESNEPITIDSDQMEWNREEKTYTASGNAKARQGKVAIEGNQITAFYSETEKNNKIDTINIIGNVKVINEGYTAFGDRGTYKVKEGFLTLKGKNLKIESGEDKLTAKDSLDYYKEKNVFVARGDAVAIREGNIIKSDVLTAYLSKTSEDGNNKIEKVFASNNVIIKTPKETATGDKGSYETKTGIVNIYGSVVITRGTDKVYGEYGQVNLNTGISKILGSPKKSEKGKKQVRAIFTFDDDKKDKKN